MVLIEFEQELELPLFLQLRLLWNVLACVEVLG